MRAVCVGVMCDSSILVKQSGVPISKRGSWSVVFRVGVVVEVCGTDCGECGGSDSEGGGSDGGYIALRPYYRTDYKGNGELSGNKRQSGERRDLEGNLQKYIYK